jgi:Carboxypeptidase regulatory-like domain
VLISNLHPGAPKTYMSRPLPTALAFALTVLATIACQRFPMGRIEGTVRDRAGEPIANVHVGVLGLASSGWSDTAGRFRLGRPVTVGRHRLRATVVGYAAVEQEVTVRKDAVTAVDLTLDPELPSSR